MKARTRLAAVLCLGLAACSTGQGEGARYNTSRQDVFEIAAITTLGVLLVALAMSGDSCSQAVCD